MIMAQVVANGGKGNPTSHQIPTAMPKGKGKGKGKGALPRSTPFEWSKAELKAEDWTPGTQVATMQEVFACASDHMQIISVLHDDDLDLVRAHMLPKLAVPRTQSIY